MNDITEAELSDLFLAARRGDSVQVLGQRKLRALADHVAKRGDVVRNVEAYEIRGELQVPRIELGLYQGSAEDADRPDAARLAASEARLKEIVEDADEEGLLFVFEVWTDEND